MKNMNVKEYRNPCIILSQKYDNTHTQNYKKGWFVYLTINKRYNNKINKDYEITNRNISDFS